VIEIFLVVRNVNNTSGNNKFNPKKIRFVFPSVIWAHGLSPVSIPPPHPPPPRKKEKRPFISFAPPLFPCHKNAPKKEGKKKKKKYSGGCCFALAVGRTGISPHI
jgi:hypothetical protein